MGDTGINRESVVPLATSNKHGAPGEALQSWYILRCVSGLDFLAEENLRESGWEIFLPRERKWQPGLWRRKPREAEASYPRFPSYLFFATVPPRWPNLRAWPFLACVRGILCMDGQPVPLAAGEIDRLRAEDGTHVPRAGSMPLHRAFVAGDPVRVLAGPFTGFEARLDVIDATGARITVQLFGRPTPARLPLTWVEAA